MNANIAALIAGVYGFGLGILSTVAWRLTAGPVSDAKPPKTVEPIRARRPLVYPPEPGIEFLQGSNFDYLCEWPVEDVELAYFGDRWTSRN